MKFLKYIMFFGALLALAGCSDEIERPVMPDAEESADSFTITASVAVPEMATQGSRAMGAAPDYAGLKLYIAEFDLNGDEPLNNFFTGLYMPDEEVPSDGLVTFKVTLKKEMKPKVLHLIAVPKDVDLQFDYGSEGTLIPGLSTSKAGGVGNEAYWQRLEFPQGYGTMTTTVDGDKWETDPALKARLTRVPMIRNFAQISVRILTETGATTIDNFTLEGFAVVNQPSAGSVAPWNNSTMRFPFYLNADNSQLDYQSISSAGYHGLLSGDAEITDMEPAETDFTTAPKFIYERPSSSVSHTYVIVKGRYGTDESSYYKADLGTTDENSVFGYYDLLRNFNYVVNIRSVGASGYATIDEAMRGVVYNNFSFDVNTEKMLNISNGTDMVWVNFTTAVVTQPSLADRTIRFRYRYKTNIGTNGGTPANENVRELGLVAGDVIESITPVTAPADSTDWVFYDIVTKIPTDETRTQSFTIVNPETGLGRKINLVLRTPWEISGNSVYAGNYNVPADFPETDTFLSKVSDLAGQPLTVFFTIPNDLPQEIFPLSFELEADRQNIENNPVGTLVVTSGPSVFDNVQGARIKYVKTISYSDYSTLLDASHPTAVKVPQDKNNPNGPTIHRVRCRFLTITSLENLGIAAGGSTNTTVRITNPYFKLAGTADDSNSKVDVGFTRTRGQSLLAAPGAKQP